MPDAVVVALNSLHTAHKAYVGRDQAVAALVPAPPVLPALSALSRLVSRLRLRDAAFLWIACFDAVRSSRTTVLLSSSAPFLASPAVIAAVKVLIWSRSSVLRLRL